MNMTNGMIRLMALTMFATIALGTPVPGWSAEDGAAAPTVIRVSDKVTVKDCLPFGSQCKQGAMYLKKPVVLNFEGLLHRQVVIGEIYADGIRSYKWRGGAMDPDVAKWYIGADVTVLSGVAKGQKRKIKEIQTRKGIAWRANEIMDRPYYVFDRPLEGIDDALRTNKRGFPGTEGVNPYHAMGILIEKNDLMSGNLGIRNVKLPEGSWGFVHNDLPPGTTGKSALLLQPEAGRKALRTRVHSSTLTDCNRVYKLAFRGKAGSAGGKLHVEFEGGTNMPSDEIALSDQWKRYERSFDMRGKFAPTKPGEPLVKQLFDLTVVLGVSGGSILLDDVEIWAEGHSNPTPWVDELVEALKLFGGGNFRRQVMAGPGLADYFKLAINQPAFTGRYNPDPANRSGSIWRPGIYDVYSLCEYLKCEPWFNTPGTIHVEEIDLMMEYIGAPADVGGGKLRASHGHPRPWTETLSRIHIEFGNEIWNFGGGYDGPDHWKDLIERGKKSPYYDPKKIIFHVGGQSVYLGRNLAIIGNAPNADRFTIAPYICHRYPKNILEACPTPADRARWVLGYGIDQNITNPSMQKQKEAAAANGMELSNYEMNHHLIALEGRSGEFAVTRSEDVAALINEYVPSQIAGVAVANNMLALLREHHMRDQSFFNLTGSFFAIRLWGGVLRASMKYEECRYRPTWLALAAVNRGIFGDLVTTSHTGAKPVFEAAGLSRYGKKKEPTTYECLWSYAFKDGPKRSIIVANLDVTKALPIMIRVPGKPGAKAQMWQSVGKDFMATNELESADPEAFLKTSSITDFQDGCTLTLPPASITTICWSNQLKQ